MTDHPDDLDWTYAQQVLTPSGVFTYRRRLDPDDPDDRGAIEAHLRDEPGPASGAPTGDTP